MGKESQQLVIILPKDMDKTPVRVIRNEENEELTVEFISQPSEEEDRAANHQHVAIFKQYRYEVICMKDILWIEATGSYCKLHCAMDNTYLVYFPLCHVQKNLPEHIFMRIHRSYLVNINQVRYISGNCLVINKTYLKIGKEYRKKVLERFIFLGVRNKPL